MAWSRAWNLDKKDANLLRRLGKGQERKKEQSGKSFFSTFHGILKFHYISLSFLFLFTMCDRPNNHSEYKYSAVSHLLTCLIENCKQWAQWLKIKVKSNDSSIQSNQLTHWKKSSLWDNAIQSFSNSCYFKIRYEIPVLICVSLYFCLSAIIIAWECVWVLKKNHVSYSALFNAIPFKGTSLPHSLMNICTDPIILVQSTW